MADTKISALAEAATLAGADEMPVVQGGTTKRVGVDTMFSSANAVWTGWVYPYTTGWVGVAGAPLTSTSWDGDARSTTAKTVIDMSAVFGVPAAVKAVLVAGAIRDSGSNGTDCYMFLAPNNTAAQGQAIDCHTINDRYQRYTFVVPCDANGDIYYQIVASGAGTMDVFLEVWGYCL